MNEDCSREGEEDLSECGPYEVCNKVDTYSTPWVERQCRCPGSNQCSLAIGPYDGHTITDRNQLLKICEKVSELPKCRYFRDITWTVELSRRNATAQTLHCRCPKGSHAYILKREGDVYAFACSPQSRLGCERKQPCRLFSVKKRETVEEVSTNTICRCSGPMTCPKHHSNQGVLAGKTYSREGIRTFLGYCL
ncbi:unnamed protein product [Darwinula stevensoni]|uniref:Uncharacterized protein n=1 Tax=Darwinula stevensoni TaxID=69355 RepID=A0A7R8XBI4_9CRUS|nr:unnamed protein product [Darwinula stevensoni]CAG0891583.1 unnamed protein product [Darwinula stevensoni]